MVGWHGHQQRVCCSLVLCEEDAARGRAGAAAVFPADLRLTPEMSK